MDGSFWVCLFTVRLMPSISSIWFNLVSPNDSIWCRQTNSREFNLVFNLVSPNELS